MDKQMPVSQALIILNTHGFYAVIAAQSGGIDQDLRYRVDGIHVDATELRRLAANVTS